MALLAAQARSLHAVIKDAAKAGDGHAQSVLGKKWSHCQYQEKPNMNPPNQPSIDIIIETSKDAVSSIDGISNAQDTKATFIAGSATTIIALVAPNLGKISPWICAVYGILYLSVMYVAWLVYKPSDYRLHTIDPVEAKKDNLSFASEAETKLALMNVLHDVFRDNNVNVQRKGPMLTRAFILLNTFFISSVALLFYPLFFKEETKPPLRPVTPAISTTPKTAPKIATSKTSLPRLKSTATPQPNKTKAAR